MILAADFAELFASYLEAGGTVAAVLLALFLQVLLVHRRRPELIVGVEPDDASEDLVHFEGFDRTRYSECYLRMKVSVEPGKNSATGTRVMLLKVHRPRGVDENLIVPDALFKWSGPSFAEDTIIPPGVWRRLDVLRYRTEFGPEAAEHGDAILAPALNRPGNTVDNDRTTWPPSARNRLRTDGWYAIDVAAACNEGDATFWRLRFYLHTADNPGRTSADLRHRLHAPSVSQLSRQTRRRGFALHRQPSWTPPVDKPPSVPPTKEYPSGATTVHEPET